jgi:hypothetical protein
MKRLRKFNEDMEHDPGYQLKNNYLVVGSMNPDEVEGQIETEPRAFANLPDGSELKFGFDEGGAEFVCIVKDGKIEVAIYEYEIMNPFVFGDVIVVPGHDSITCFNYKTDEVKVGYIR